MPIELPCHLKLEVQLASAAAVGDCSHILYGKSHEIEKNNLLGPREQETNRM